MRAPQRAAVLSTFSSNEWDSKQDKTWIFGPSERHGDRARTDSPRETQHLSSLIKNSPRHRKKRPSHFGPEEKFGTLVRSLDGEEWGPLLFRWMKTTVRQATHSGGLRAC